MTTPKQAPVSGGVKPAPAFVHDLISRIDSLSTAERMALGDLVELTADTSWRDEEGIARTYQNMVEARQKDIPQRFEYVPITVKLALRIATALAEADLLAADFHYDGWEALQYSVQVIAKILSDGTYKIID